MMKIRICLLGFVVPILVAMGLAVPMRPFLTSLADGPIDIQYLNPGQSDLGQMLVDFKVDAWKLKTCVQEYIQHAKPQVKNKIDVLKLLSSKVLASNGWLTVYDVLDKWQTYLTKHQSQCFENFSVSRYLPEWVKNRVNKIHVAEIPYYKSGTYVLTLDGHHEIGRILKLDKEQIIKKVNVTEVFDIFSQEIKEMPQAYVEALEKLVTQLRLLPRGGVVKLMDAYKFHLTDLQARLGQEGFTQPPKAEFDPQSVGKTLWQDFVKEINLEGKVTVETAMRVEENLFAITGESFDKLKEPESNNSGRSLMGFLWIYFGFSGEWFVHYMQFYMAQVLAELMEDGAFVDRVVELNKSLGLAPSEPITFEGRKFTVHYRQDCEDLSDTFDLKATILHENGTFKDVAACWHWPLAKALLEREEFVFLTYLGADPGLQDGDYQRNLTRIYNRFVKLYDRMKVDKQRQVNPEWAKELLKKLK